MKTKIINSQISNFRTYNMYLKQMCTLATNVFEFENMPTYIDKSYLNNTLLKKGSIAFFKDEVLGLLALPYTTSGKKDVYGRPVGIRVIGDNGYQRTLAPDEYVIMYDNNGRYPIYLDICQYAERIALNVRTQDVNIKQQRTPRIFKVTNQDTELSIKRMMDDIDSGTDTIATHKDIITDQIDTVLAPAPYVTDKIDLHLKELWAEFFRLIGVSNLVMQKKERMITDEMSASQGGTIASRWSRFEPRERAIKEINEKFNLNISVRYYDGEPDSKKGDDDVSDDVSNVSDDTEFVQVEE